MDIWTVELILQLLKKKSTSHSTSKLRPMLTCDENKRMYIPATYIKT